MTTPTQKRVGVESGLVAANTNNPDSNTPIDTKCLGVESGLGVVPDSKSSWGWDGHTTEVTS
jgi:hypothetical protein